MKRKLIYLAGILIFTFAFAIAANAQDKVSEQKKETKKEMTDKQLRKELGLTKAEFEKIPEKCKNCPHLQSCKGTSAVKTVKSKESVEGETAVHESKEKTGTKSAADVRQNKQEKKK